MTNANDFYFRIAELQHKRQQAEQREAEKRAAETANQREIENIDSQIRSLQRQDTEQRYYDAIRRNDELVASANQAGARVTGALENLLAGKGNRSEVEALYQAHCRAFDAQQNHAANSGIAYAGRDAAPSVFAPFKDAVLPGSYLKEWINGAHDASERRWRQGVVFPLMEDGRLPNPPPDYNAQQVTDQEFRNRRRSIDILG